MNILNKKDKGKKHASHMVNLILIFISPYISLMFVYNLLADILSWLIRMISN